MLTYDTVITYDILTYDTVITYDILTYDTVITYKMKYKKKNDLHGTFIITCVPDYSCFLLGCFSILH